MALEVSENRCVASVVIPAFNARKQIGSALVSLHRQTLDEPFEIIVVASGEDNCAEYIRQQHPSVQVIESPRRLYPGQARNAGVRAACGEIVAFASADTQAPPSWLAQRLAAHRSGCELVGGSILNGTPGSWVGTAGYLLEYSALLPVEVLLRRQDVPHALSFKRSVFELLGEYPEDVLTGEDTIFNTRCIDAGLSFGFAPPDGLMHENPRRLRDFLTHAAAHGRGLAQCIHLHGLPAAIEKSDASTAWRRTASTCRYTIAGLVAKYRRIVRFSPQWLPSLIISTPLILTASVVTAHACLNQLRLLGADERRHLDRHGQS